MVREPEAEAFVDPELVDRAETTEALAVETESFSSESADEPLESMSRDLAAAETAFLQDDEASRDVQGSRGRCR